MNDDIIKRISELSNIEMLDAINTSVFEELGFDIVDLAELIITLEDELGITLDNNMYSTKISVGELVDEIERLKINKL